MKYPRPNLSLNLIPKDSSTGEWLLLRIWLAICGTAAATFVFLAVITVGQNNLMIEQYENGPTVDINRPLPEPPAPITGVTPKP